MSKLPKFDFDPKVLVGLDTSDDAAVYALTDDLAMIQTVDFFTPIVDDPYMFGQVAAANALSDVYAMGGIPKLALNIVGFPNCLSPDVLSEIMRVHSQEQTEEDILNVILIMTVDTEVPKGLFIQMTAWYSTQKIITILSNKYIREN